MQPHIGLPPQGDPVPLGKTLMRIKPYPSVKKHPFLAKYFIHLVKKIVLLTQVDPLAIAFEGHGGDFCVAGSQNHLI